jgi:formiminotetrahydrofolate cyclodeaminase
MNMTQQSVDQFLEQLAGSGATPGGGSAAAVMGAMGAALVSMVCNVSLGKKGCEAAEGEILAIRAESEALRARLTAMVADDIAAFDALMAAYKLPKLTDEDKVRRSAVIQAGLLGATEVPLECARACAAVISLAQRVAHIGYKGVISDAGVGVLSAYAALRSAALNVYINEPALTDRAAAGRFRAQIDSLTAAAAAEHDAVYAIVRTRL